MVDPENLADYLRVPPKAFVRAGSGVTGALPAFTVPEGVVGGWCVFRCGNELRFGVPQATVLVLR